MVVLFCEEERNVVAPVRAETVVFVLADRGVIPPPPPVAEEDEVLSEYIMLF